MPCGQLIEAAVKCNYSLDQKAMAKTLHENDAKTIVGPIAFPQTASAR